MTSCISELLTFEDYWIGYSVLNHGKFCKLVYGHDLTVGVPATEDTDDQNMIDGSDVVKLHSHHRISLAGNVTAILSSLYNSGKAVKK